MAVRDKLVTSTIDLIRRRGVAGTGIAAILEHSGVSRRSIYLAFPGGKAEMVAAATRQAGDVITEYIKVLRGSADPLAGFVHAWKARLADSGFAAGCPIAAAALGRSDSPDAATAASETFTAWTELLASQLADTGVPENDCVGLASVIISAVEGAIVMAVAQETAEPLDHVQRYLTTLIATHAAPNGRHRRSEAKREAHPTEVSRLLTRC